MSRLRNFSECQREDRDDRLERVFLCCTRMDMLTRTEFKRLLATQESIDITLEDVDLLAWDETGTSRARILKQESPFWHN
jgi:hypothetical protein